MSASKKYPELPRKKYGPGWWLHNRNYTRYMLRELTSFFVAVYAILYIYQVALLATSAGPCYPGIGAPPCSVTPYDQYVANVLKNPLMIGFSIIILGFTLYHAVT